MRGLVLLLGASLLTAGADQKVYRIMPLGDSITAGGDRFSNYRFPLWEMLNAAGYPVEFVGSRTEQFAVGPLRHEGWGGKNAEFLAALLEKSLRTNVADILLVHTGHNHSNTEAPVPGIVATTSTIVRLARAANPKVAVLLAQVIPSGKLPKYEYIPELNASLVQLALQLDSPQSRVIGVNMADGFDWRTDTVEDRVHPNARGAEKMAGKWFVALTNLIGRPPAVPALAPASQIAAAPLDSSASKSPLRVHGAHASSILGNNTASKAVDGVIGDNSRWVSQASSEPAWLELDLGGAQKLGGIHLYSGYQNTSPIEDFVVQYWRDGAWHDIPCTATANNRATAIVLPFDDTVEVTTDKLRLWITGSYQNIARLLEVVVWPASVGSLPPLAPPEACTSPTIQNEPVPLIYLNQSGFNLGKPKRFTAPTLSGGTPFEVRPAEGGSGGFKGTIDGKQVGDFSEFNSSDKRNYVVVAGTNFSVPFRIGRWWLERVTYQGAVDFMVDSRHYIGNERAVCPGSFGWRDDHHFAWELHTLVPQWLSNPSAYERMPRQVKYEPPANPRLWGALQAYREDAPDVVKLIHWGADVIVSQGLTHELLKAQLAYFLYAWPSLKQYLPAQNYDVVREFTFRHWSATNCDRTYPYDESEGHDLLAVKTKLGSTKGALPPGFSVEPNLLLYEVARRERQGNAENYFQAAYKQAEWMIAHLDWNDPQTTKGQRMSEWVTMTGLTHLLREYPNRAPAGLKASINAWAAVVIRRSDNLWDFRKLDDGHRWTPMGEKPTMWNEPGNVVGLPAALLAARQFLTNSATKARVEQLVWSHFDNLFGRNPTGRHFSYDAPREIEGVEHGWFSYLQGGIGRLAQARFVIDGSPKDGHYPYHPERGDYGWTEGWVQFNTAFNISLAYLAWADTRLQLHRDRDDLVVSLEAPLNFDYARAETAKVWVNSGNGDLEDLEVTEDSPNSGTLTGRIQIDSKAPVRPGDGILQSAPGARTEAGYGYGYLGRRIALEP